MFKCTVNYKNNTSMNINLKIEKKDNIINYTLRDPLNFSEVDSLDFWMNDIQIKAGDEGYFFIPGGCGESLFKDSGIGYFKEHKDAEYVSPHALMPNFGLKHKSGTFIAIVTGMPEESWHIVKIKDNKYYFALRINISGHIPYEEPSVEQHILPTNSDYNDMAKEYRKYILSKGYKTITERLNPHLKYTTESIYVRIRMGWKPAPCVVKNQTLENEPPMHVSCTFADVEKIMYEYKRQGIKKAEFCLVGWNVSGHDGRWPQIFPVEEKLGGEEGLKKLIDTANKLGYAIVCHTNSSDAYTIADCFSDDLLIHLENGKPRFESDEWSGGSMYAVCPKVGYEYALRELPKVRELGFKGTHYIDVISVVPPRECFSKQHSLNKREAVEYNNKLFEYCQKLFGGMSSEGAYEYSMRYCDFALYLSFRNDDDLNTLIDEYIPFWQIVFHGIVLSNPYSNTINVPVKRKKDLLKLIEYGARPTLYYYSKFLNNGRNWMGEEDFVADSDEDIVKYSAFAKELSAIYEEMSYLQYEFIDKHERVADGIYRVTYSDGSIIIVDYNSETYSLKKCN